MLRGKWLYVHVGIFFVVFLKNINLNDITLQNLYFIIFALLVLLSIMDFTCRNQKLKRIVYILIGSILVIYAGLRDGNYVFDYKMYQWLYNEEIYVVEPTFTIISLITRYILGGNIIWLFLIYAIIGVGIKFIAIKRLSPLIFLSVLIYVADFFPLQEMAQMRAAVATGIMLLAIEPLYERKRKKFAVLTLIAVLFHVSSIVMILLWFLNSDRINRKFWITLIFVGYIVAFLKVDIISLLSYMPLGVIRDKYEIYRTQQEDGNYVVNVFSLLFLIKLFLAFLLLWKSEIIIEKNKYGYLLLKIMFVGLASLLLLSQNLAAGLRISEFYGVVSIVLFPMLYYIVRPRWFAWTTIVIITIGFVIVRIFSMQLISSIPL